ncbi:MAG TPA: hypothetical protein DIT04_11090 [Dysgonomonas sp.]|nr:hypothetical protein [Dysgonomonas sp.]
MRNIFKLFTVLFICFSISGCGSLDGYSPNYVYSSLYKGGYWGEWKMDSFKSSSSYNNNSFTMVIYPSNRHPSEYNAKITATSFNKKEGDWFEYTGVIQLQSSYEYFDKMGDYYNQKDKISLTNSYLSYPCIIRLSKPIKDIYKKHGMMNVFYNGVGRAYKF